MSEARLGQHRAEQAEIAVPARFRSSRVLLAISSDELQERIRLLRRYFAVESVGNGEAALASARANRPAVIVADETLSMAAGRDLLDFFRGDPELSGIPFISLVTGAETTPQDDQLAADDYVREPFAVRELAARIRIQLEMAELRDAVTRYTTTENILCATTERYRALFENTEHALVIVEPLFDATGKVVDLLYKLINPAFEKQTGLRAADFTGKRLLDVLPGTELRRLEKFDRVVKTGQPVHSEEFYPGTGRWYETVVFPHPNGLLAESIVDVTARRKAEAALRENEERQAFLLTLSNALRMIADPIEIQTTVTHLTRDHYRADRCYYCEVEAENAVIRRDASRTDLPSVAGVYSLTRLPLYRQLSETGRSIVVTDVNTAEGLDDELKRLCIQLQIVAFINTPVMKHGKLVGNLCITQCVQRQWTRAEVDLARDAAEQSWAAVERGRAEAALQTANARLVEADRRKNEFLAMLSHELRNPLAPIRNSLHVLDQAPMGGDQARRAQAIIERQIGHLTRLVDDLLDVSRITRGTAVLQRERLDLCDLVRRTVDDHREAFADRQIALEIAVEPHEVWVNGDRTRLSQVVGNLLANAVKFTPSGGKTTVTVHAAVARGEACVAIRDTGRGIVPELLSRLFEPFTQADSSFDRKLGGLGLGLSIVKGLVEMHGGSVTAHSDGVSKGATFTITLPIDAAVATAPQRTTIANKSVARRILVIEDNVDAAESLGEVLTLCGHTVEIALTGPAGLEKARIFHPEVVLCDIGLPEIDGYEMARRMRADPELRTARLVALSGYASPDDVAKAKAAGFDTHLAKPSSLAKVENAIRGS